MVFDPLLPRKTLAALYSGSGSLVVGPRGTPPRSRKFRDQRAWLGVSIFCGVMALVVVLAVVASPAAAWAVGAVSGFAYIPPNRVDRLKNLKECMKTSGLMPLVLGGVLMAPVSLGSNGAVILVNTMVHALACGMFIGFAREGTTHVVGLDQIVAAEDLRPFDRGLLRQVRNVRREVEEAQRALAPAFDGTPVLMALAEEEWRLAVRMKAMAPLAAKVDRLSANAATDRIRRALRSQVEAVRAARDADQRAVQRINRYVKPVRRAHRAHREWEQAFQVVDSAAEHAGLIGLAKSDEGERPLDGFPRLAGDLDLEAARLAREELTAEVLDANTWLLNELRRGGEAANG